MTWSYRLQVLFCKSRQKTSFTGVSTKKTAFKTSISLTHPAKEVCDAYIEAHGLRENITSLSDLVGRALMAYCLPPVAGDNAVVLTSAGAGKIVSGSSTISNTPSDTRDTLKSDAALADSVSKRVKALKPLADRIRNSHTERK